MLVSNSMRFCTDIFGLPAELLEDKFGFEFKEMSKMTEEIFAHMLGNIGVPAALCFYTLFQVNRTMEKLIQSIDKLETRIDRLEDRIFSLYGSKE